MLSLIFESFQIFANVRFNYMKDCLGVLGCVVPAGGWRGGGSAVWTTSPRAALRGGAVTALGKEAVAGGGSSWWRGPAARRAWGRPSGKLSPAARQLAESPDQGGGEMRFTLPYSGKPQPSLINN